MTVRFEHAGVSDIPVIFAQAKELIDTYEDVSSIDYDKVLAWVKRKITEHISEYRCAVVDDKKCAFWRLCADGELDDLYVLPAFRGMGIGTQIMEKCMEESEKTIYLYVFSRNIRAISFYERFGISACRAVSPTRIIMGRCG